jgi:hypothetical protein
MEEDCLFVNIRGILKSCHFHSKNPKSSWSYDVDYLDEMVCSSKMFDSMSIYVCTDVIPYFINRILPQITNSFVFVTGDSDASVYGGKIDIHHNNPINLEKELCYDLINNPLLIKWYSQNCIINHEKVIQLPIGLDYHTISNNPNKNWRDIQANEGYLPNSQEDILKNIRINMKPFNERMNRVYITCNIGNSGIKSDLITEKTDSFLTRTQLWKKMINYTFIYAPYRHGIDSHRQWEALLLGCIPIVQTIGTNKLFEELPVIIVNDYSEVTRELLDNALEKFSTMNFNYDKLLLSYWTDQINGVNKID